MTKHLPLSTVADKSSKSTGGRKRKRAAGTGTTESGPKKPVNAYNYYASETRRTLGTAHQVTRLEQIVLNRHDFLLSWNLNICAAGILLTPPLCAASFCQQFCACIFYFKHFYNCIAAGAHEQRVEQGGGQDVAGTERCAETAVREQGRPGQAALRKGIVHCFRHHLTGNIFCYYLIVSFRSAPRLVCPALPRRATRPTTVSSARYHTWLQSYNLCTNYDYSGDTHCDRRRRL